MDVFFIYGYEYYKVKDYVFVYVFFIGVFVL